jgi:hypothetical protein
MVRLTRCTADPASQTDGYRSDLGGEHQSAPAPVRLGAAVLSPVRDGTAWLSEACAPWTCATYLRVQLGDLHLSMPADDARRVLADLSALLSLADTAEEVTDEVPNRQDAVGPYRPVRRRTRVRRGRDQLCAHARTGHPP